MGMGIGNTRMYESEPDLGNIVRYHDTTRVLALVYVPWALPYRRPARMGAPRGQSWQKIGTDAVTEPRYPSRFLLAEARKTAGQKGRPKRSSARGCTKAVEADQAHHGRESAAFGPRGAAGGDWVVSLEW